MLIQNGYVIKKKWVLLDTCFIDSVTNNLDYVEDAKNCAKHKELTVLANRGSLLFDRKVRLNFLPLNVQVNYDSLLTVISFKDVNNIIGVRVTMDTSIEKAMNTILRYGTVFKFKEF